MKKYHCFYIEVFLYIEVGVLIGTEFWKKIR